MNRIERFLVYLMFLNMVCLIAITIYTEKTDQSDEIMVAVSAWHIAGILLNFFVLALTIRDLALRDFPDPNSKLYWSVWIFWTGGIAWFVYLFKHALKPRPDNDQDRVPQPN